MRLTRRALMRGVGALAWHATCAPVPAAGARRTIVGGAAVGAVGDPLDFRGALVNDILPFWERSVDREHGGFITELDVDGNRHDGGPKPLFIQARMIYSFSLGHRLTGKPEYLAYAAQGVEFLKQRFWDDQFGGWYRSTTREGEPLDRMKWPYGLSFAAYGLAEYARASGDRAALTLAAETHELHRRHAWDHERGGVYWELERDWSIDDPSKRLDVMLHAMEAASSLLAATCDDRYLADLNRLVDTIVSRPYDPAQGCIRDWSTADWEEDLRRTNHLVDYGHTAEAAWFTLLVGAYTGNRVHLEFGRSILGYVLRQAWDPVYGGIFSTGRCEGGVASEVKEWWRQGELLGALSVAYRLTGDVQYLDWLKRLAAFIHRHQRDPRDGEWYAQVERDGTIRDGRKGFAGKAAYHVVQALYHADRSLALVMAHGPTVPGAPGARWEDFAL